MTLLRSSNPKQQQGQATGEQNTSSYTAVLGQGMLANNVLLPELLGSQVTRWYPWHRLTKRGSELPSTFAGWGQKKSFQRAKNMAHKLGVSTLSVEDGFLRSIHSGIQSRYGCSIVLDDIGIYFELHHASKLENDIAYRARHWSNERQRHAQTLIDSLISHRLSKYNATLDCPTLNEISEGRYSEHVLLIDQVAGDASIRGAGANKYQFEKMLKVACQSHPNAKVWIKAHPAGKKGYLNDIRLLNKLKTHDRQRVSIIDTAVNPIALIEQVNTVYSVSSHMGFEALMLNKTVYCFGVSWYSGWGLTQDDYAPKALLKKVVHRRNQRLKDSGLDTNDLDSNVSVSSKVSVRSKRTRQSILKNTVKRGQDWLNKPQQLPHVNASISLHQLFYAAYIDYSRYADPASGKRCDIEQVIQWLNTNRNWYLELPAKITVFEFSRWKTGFVTDFLSAINNYSDPVIKFKKKPKFAFLQRTQRLQRFNVDLSHDFLVWGLAARQRVTQLLSKKLEMEGKRTTQNRTAPNIWCMEDGFIRSNGLGATLLAPLSVVVDKLGIYYDATKASDLERLIAQCQPLTQEQSSRVTQLHQKLLSQRVSKYHVGQPTTLSIPQFDKGLARSVILVVGQVEDDLSVQYCGSSIKTNSALIESVRLNNPNAYLIYKPHPDVEAGLRTGKVSDSVLKQVDDVAYDVAMPDCLDVVDEVHTISSLTGFEALLRGKSVFCYGLPFYAGWGLTTELDAHVYPKADLLQRRRNARSSLTLEQLIHCTLIEYPLYRLPEGYGYAQVEQVIDYLYPPADSTTKTVDEMLLNRLTAKSGDIFINKNKPQPGGVSKLTVLKRGLAKKAMQARHSLKNRLNERIK